MNSHFRACLSFSTFDVWVTRSGDRYLVNQDEGLVQMFPNSNFEVRWTETLITTMKCSNDMITRLIQTFTFWSLFLSGTHLCRSGTDTGLPPKSNILSLMLSSSKSNYQPPHRSTGNSLFCWIAILLTSVIGTTLFWSCFFVHVKFHGCILINDLLKKFYGCKYVIFLYGDVHDSIWMFRGSSLF